MVLLFLKNDGSYIWRLNNKGLKYSQETKKIFECKLQEANTHLKRSLMKMYLQHNEFVRYLMGRAPHQPKLLFQVFLENKKYLLPLDQPRDKGNFGKIDKQANRCHHKTYWKATEAFLRSAVGSDVGVILSFLGRSAGFVSEHTWALIAFVGVPIEIWLMQKVKN